MFGRKNWDFVSMQDYQSDMAETSNQARGIIEAQRREIDALNRTIWLLVKSAGGTLDLHASEIVLFDKKHATLEMSDRPDIAAIRFVALLTPSN